VLMHRSYLMLPMLMHFLPGPSPSRCCWYK
jgi:hypothetical protein